VAKALPVKAETDLYHPVRDYLVANGYTVRGEVKDCDITALKGDDLIIVELKRTFNASLIIQATQRQKITDSVYVVLPRPASGIGTPQWRGIRHLLRRLELGLILVSLRARKSKVEVVFHPVPFDRRKTKAAKRAVIREIEGRAGDFNLGGSTRTKLATAYRENAIHIACCLEKHGQLSPKQLRAMGTGDKTQSILASNFYGWFERVDRGVYALKPGAVSEIAKHPDLLEHYRAALTAG
jgi:hypothetical protein